MLGEPGPGSIIISDGLVRVLLSFLPLLLTQLQYLLQLLLHVAVLLSYGYQLFELAHFLYALKVVRDIQRDSLVNRRFI